VSEVGGHFSLYTDFISKKYLVLASSFGASHIFGNYEIEQAQYLGLMEGLRGYRITRFAGRTRAYNNTELRVNFGEVNALLFRAPIGLLVFNDVGRVWADEEKSNVWHDGYGGGLWISPLKRVVIAGSMTFSNEEKWLLLVNFGFQF
jgi:outer membrane protein assembly factor BamA